MRELKAGAWEWEGAGRLHEPNWSGRVEEHGIARQGSGRGRIVTRGMDQGGRRGLGVCRSLGGSKSLEGVGAWQWEGTSTGACDGAGAWVGQEA